MFNFVRAGGLAAAFGLLGASSFASAPSYATIDPAPVAGIGFADHQLADGSTIQFAADQKATLVPVSAVPAAVADHSAVNTDSESDAATPVAPSASAIAAPARAARKAATGNLASLVLQHKGSSTPDRERECLAVAIYYESKGEPLSGQLAVGQVVKNRAKSGRFPRSMCGVVLQRSQFSFIRGGRLPSVPRASAQWKTAVAVAHIVANDMADEVAPKALFFHARYVSPGWKRLSRVATVGNHIFYR